MFNYSIDKFIINYPETIIERSDGITVTEKCLNKLSENTFLSLWSYPNLYTDQNKKNETSVGKELCDLLVIFENHIIIFSDKNCKFNDISNGNLSNKDLIIKWKRWYKKSIEKSAGQIYKAEDWICNHSNRIFLDAKCKKRFPFDIPNKKDVIIHRIVVTHSIANICKKYTGNEYGSFFIDSNIIGSKKEFSIGYINEYKKFVHILNDFSLDLLMKELDTASDFINYLNMKEELFQNKNIIAYGEEDILARYLFLIDKEYKKYKLFLKEDFKYIKEENKIILKKNIWKKMKESKQYLKKKSLNQKSYVWDFLLEKACKHYITGTQLYRDKWANRDKEKDLFIAFSRFNRLERRKLSQMLLDFIKVINKKKKNYYKIVKYNDKIIYLLALCKKPNETFNVYRENRISLLYKKICRLKMHKYKYIDEFLGIAFNIDSPKDESIDICYLNDKYWIKYIKSLEASKS